MLGPNRDATLALAGDAQTMDKADLWRAANLRGRGTRGKIGITLDISFLLL